MSKEKRLFKKGRTSVYVVYPRRRELKYFDDVFFIPTIFIFTLNTISSRSKYQYTRYTTLAFLWFSIELRVEYGKVEVMEEMEMYPTLKAALQNLGNAILACGIGKKINNDASAKPTHDDDINSLINNAQ